jgi:hypothetical protein
MGGPSEMRYECCCGSVTSRSSSAPEPAARRACDRLTTVAAYAETAQGHLSYEDWTHAGLRLTAVQLYRTKRLSTRCSTFALRNQLTTKGRGRDRRRRTNMREDISAGGRCAGKGTPRRPRLARAGLHVVRVGVPQLSVPNCGHLKGGGGVPLLGSAGTTTGIARRETSGCVRCHGWCQLAAGAHVGSRACREVCMQMH